jgi:hypothetical protein
MVLKAESEEGRRLKLTRHCCAYGAKTLRSLCASKESRVTEVAANLASTGSFSDPSRARLLETRKALLNAWLNVADSLDVQGDHILASDVGHFARHLPRVLTDGEHIATALGAHSQQRHTNETTLDKTRNKARESTR